MKKKIGNILLALTLTLCMTACGDGKVKPMIDNPHEQLDMVVALITNMVMERPGAEQLAILNDYNDDELDGITESILNMYQLHMDGRVYRSGIISYNDSYELIGRNNIEDMLNDPSVTAEDVVKALNITYTVGDKKVVAEAHINGELHNAVVEIIFDKNLHVTSVNTNILYNLQESMQKAGQNTLIGMGTVFVMLILISIIISGMKIIPTLQENMAKKKESKEKEEMLDNAISDIIKRETAVEVPAEEADDDELIAVIAAAIAAASEEAGGPTSTEGFVVRSIRRIR